MPVFVFHLKQGFEGLNPCIGKQYVNAAERALRLYSSRSQRGKVALVELDTQPAATGRLDQLSRFLQLIRARCLDTGAHVHGGADVDTDDVRTLSGEGDGRGAADPTGSAGEIGRASCRERV